MSRSFHRLSLAGVVLTVGLLSSAAASATPTPTKGECVDTNAQAQQLRREGKISLATERLRVCMSPACPAIVRDDCTKRLDEALTAQPTVVLEAKDESEADVSAVSVELDGKPLTSRLNGSALPVDVGEHVFTFSAEGHPPVTKKVILSEGEHGRRVHVTLGAAPRAGSEPLAPPRDDLSLARSNVARVESTADQRASGLRPWAWVSVAAATAGVGAGVAFALLSHDRDNAASALCPGGQCPTSVASQLASVQSTATSDGRIAIGAFVFGAAAAITAGTLFALAAPSKTAAPPQATLTPFLGLGVAGVQGAF